MKQEVEFIEDFPEMVLVNRKIGPFREGQNVELRPWVAYRLEQEGVVNVVEDFDATEIRKKMIREEKSTELRDVSEIFYLGVSEKIDSLMERGREEEAKELRDVSDSFISLRMKKIAEMAVSSSTPKEVPPEERLLSNLLCDSINTWRERLESSFERENKKEAGARERTIRRSIRGIVRNTANI